MLVALCVVVASMMSMTSANLPTDCQSVVYSEATTPLACVMITRSQLSFPSLNLDTGLWGTVGQLSQDGDTSDSTYNDLLQDWVDSPVGAGQPNPVTSGGVQNPTVVDAMTALNPNALPGACRWDLERSNKLGSDQACLCPATETTCSLGRKECYWYEMPDSNALDIPTFACINSAERFYHLLARLLKKRGKKDFAIKIRYGATPARGQLPLGPYGPAIIGGGSHNKMALALQQLGRGMMSRFGGPQYVGHQGPQYGGHQGPQYGGHQGPLQYPLPGQSSYPLPGPPHYK